MAATQEVKTVLNNARGTLKTAEMGLSMLLSNSDADTQMAGLRNVAIFGRAVTFALQNLRGKAEVFDEWYDPKVEEMKKDEVMKFFVELRNDIEKKGDLGTNSALRLNGMVDPQAITSRFPAPPGGGSFFIGDKFGGSGYMVKLPDGTEETYYVTMPSKLPSLSLDMTVQFTNAPKGHEQRPVGEMCKEYLSKIRLLLEEATKNFGT